MDRTLHNNGTQLVQFCLDDSPNTMNGWDCFEVSVAVQVKLTDEDIETIRCRIEGYLSRGYCDDERIVEKVLEEVLGPTGWEVLDDIRYVHITQGHKFSNRKTLDDSQE